MSSSIPNIAADTSNNSNSSPNSITAMIVDDEAPMRDLLRLRLQKVWPTLHIITEASNGIMALEQNALHKPDIIFLDIRMPGKNGIETAAELAGSAHLVFVTAYDEYAISAFERGAIDYLLKPVDVERLTQTCTRLQERLALSSNKNIHDITQTANSNTMTNNSKNIDSNHNTDSEAVTKLLSQIMEHNKSQQREYLRWIQASVGSTLRMINTKEILFFKSDEKYTLVQTEQAEFLIRKTLKELEDELDPKQFWRIHRSSLVNVNAIADVSRDMHGRLLVGVKGNTTKLEVSRNNAHLFQQM